MADRTAQPGAGVGLHPALAGFSPKFLWNAADANKNAVDGSDSGTGLRGTSYTSGTGMVYRRFGGDGQMTFTVPGGLPTGSYTLVAVMVFPASSVTGSVGLRMGGSGGARIENYTTGGGVYQFYFHTAVAEAAPPGGFVTGVGGFNELPWVEVFEFDVTVPNQLVRLRKDGAGVDSSNTQTIAYANPSTSTIELGDPAGNTTNGYAAFLLLGGAVGSTEREALRANAWRMFAPEPEPGELTGDITTDDAAPTGALTGGAPSVLTGSITTDDAAPTGTIVAAPPATITMVDWSNAAGDLLPGITVPHLVVMRRSDRQVVVSLADQVVSGGPTPSLAITHPSLVAGTWYVVSSWAADGSAMGIEQVQAA